MCNQRKVHFQYIGFDDLEVLVLPQPGGQVPVQFDDGEVSEALDQRLRQRGQARADFDHGVARLRRNGGHDGIDDCAIGQKMLAKAFAGNVLHTGSRYST